MKRKILSISIILLLFSSLFLTASTSAFEKEVYNFDRIWYDDEIGFNKNGIGILVLGVTYTNNTFREIDYCHIEFHQDPFYFGIEFQEESEVLYDSEGNIIYQEPIDGYVYLRKAVVDNYLPNSIKRIASTINYSTITFQGVKWYRIYVPNFNRLYEWKKFNEPSLNKKWYTWGSNESILFNTKAMYVKQTKGSTGHLEFDFTHPIDNSGQKVAINKSYLSSKGITNPVFEWGEKVPWKGISYSENETHYFITPEHFSFVGIHEASTGSVPGFVTNYNNTDYPSGGVQLEYTGSATDTDTLPTYPGYEYQTMNINWTWITKVNVRLGFTGTRTIEIGIKDNSGVTLTSLQRTINGAGTHWDMFDFADINTSGKNTVYKLYASKVAGAGAGWCYVPDSWAFGEASFDNTKDYCFKLYGVNHYNVTRTSGGTSETNNATFTSGYNFNSTDNITLLKIPVSSSVQAVTRVYNLSTGFNATEVVSLVAIDEQFEYFYDSANYDVYLGVANISSSDTLTWQVNATYGSDFSMIFPTYKTVGDDIFIVGMIEDANGNGIDGVTAYTYVYYQNGSVAIGPIKWNCTGGNFFTAISTTSLIPGIYSISVEFTDSATGITFKEGATLYLSHQTPSGVYSDAIVVFNFYNTNEALGLPMETLKIYVDGVRQYENVYYTYTGANINVTIKDYYNTTLFSNNYTINYDYMFLDLGITFHSYKFCNLNEEDYMLSLLKENGSRWYERGICPFETVEYIIPSGNYTLRAYNSTLVELFNFTDTINSSNVYLIYGTNLSTIIEGQSIITDYLQNGTEYFNGSFSGIIDNLTGIDDLLNRSIVVFNFYNTNQGLGLDRETLKILVNGTRLIGNLYYGFNNTIINLTIKDFYNFTLYQGNYTINEPFEFIDLGLTFHSWKFGNLQNIPYMVSLLKEGASRWWERGVMPYSDVEFMLPSGNYTLRIYDDAYNEIHNQSYVVNNSRLYAIAGGSLVLLINGQSVIRGQLLELLATLDYALTPDIEIISYNPPMIRSCFEKRGMPLGDNVWVVDPIYNIQATTRQETFGNYINSTALIPGNGSVANGTITILKDTMWILGNGSVSWVNITYTDNGTLYRNTTSSFSRFNLYGQNLTINASCDINVQRETDYNQMKHFGWMVKGDTGEHTYTIDVENPFNNAPIYDVYVYVAFSNESTPNENTVTILDIANGKLELETGKDYKTTSGIEFFVLSIPANTTREFALSYYWSDYSQLNYDTDIIYVDDYKTKQSVTFDDKFYNSFTKTWVNDESTTFRGEIIIALDFAKSNEIEPTSIHIWDAKNSRYLNRSMFYYGTGSIRISSEAIGDVSPGGGNEFTVYFRFMEYPGADPTEWHLNSIITYLGPIPITTYSIIFVIAIITLGIGLISIILSETKKKTWKGKLLIGIGVFVLFVFYILQAQGV